MILRVKNSKEIHDFERFTSRSLIPIVSKKNPLALPAGKGKEEPF